MQTNLMDTLLAARNDHVAIDALPEMPADIEAAYAVQGELVGRIGLPTIGWKIGCTSVMAQRISRVNEPFFGHMFAATTTASPATISLANFFNPIVEPEIAFRMARDLPASGAPYDEAAVSEAVAAIFPAIEMVDSRYNKAWKIDIRETVSDNGVHAFFVTGREQNDWRAIDRPSIPLIVTTNGVVTADGIGSNALEDPMNALVWLANGLAQRGLCLSAGDLVTTGNICNEPIRPKAGDAIVAEFGSLGSVQVTFE
jgi:2-keto-4-pentenoate hydratase